MFGAADLDVFFADMGVTCVAAGQTATVLLDAPGESLDLGGSHISAVDYRMTFKTTALSLMSVRQQITVDGNKYIVSAIDPLDDGQISRATLEKV
jgi:hypothetical protein